MPGFFGIGKSKKSGSSSSGKEIRALLLGLDGAGTTALLYKLKLGENITTIPTIGFNVETIAPGKNADMGKKPVTMWDVGGQEKIRPLWRHYVENTAAFVFVLDGADPERLDEAVAAFENIERVILEENASPSLLLAINKIDLLDEASRQRVFDAVEKKFKRDELEKKYEHFDMIEMSVKDGDGLEEFKKFFATRGGGGGKQNNKTTNAWHMPTDGAEPKKSEQANGDDDG